MSFVGEPFLAAVSTDAILRLYRLSAGVFVQVGSTGNRLPFGQVGVEAPLFAKDGTPRLFYSQPSVNDSASATQLGLFDADYSNVGFGTPANLYNVNGGGYPTLGRMAVGRNHLLTGDDVTPVFLENQMLTVQGNVPGTGQGVSALVNVGAGTAFRTYDNGVLNQGISDCNLALSPDQMMLAMIAGQNGTGLVIWDTEIARMKANNAVPQQGYNASIPGAQPFRLVFSEDSRYLICAKKNGTISIYEITAHAAATNPVVSSTVGIAQVPYEITDIANFGRFLAVGQKISTGVYTTSIFQRGNQYLNKLTEIAGIGADLNWSEDGTLLIDAVTKHGYTRAGNVFTEAAGMMANISGSVLAASLSPHVPLPAATSSFYDFAAGDFADQTINLATLKVMLLGAHAFVPGQTTVAQVIASAGEVYGNGWPQGGKALVNVTATKDRTGLTLKADKITQGIITAASTSRAAIIYSGTRPLIYIDFKVARTVEAGSTLEIDMNTNGFLSTQGV